MIRKVSVIAFALLAAVGLKAQDNVRLSVMGNRAVRFQMAPEGHEWNNSLVFTEKPLRSVSGANGDLRVKTSCFTASYDKAKRIFTVTDEKGKVVVKTKPLRNDELRLVSANDEYLCGLGQFQDGYLNVRGLSRRLTQVNTQISVPFILSNKGYAVLWHNYGLTEFNPSEHTVAMRKAADLRQSVLVDVTSTTGNKRERREVNAFVADINVDKDGDYSIMVDVGQKMARRHEVIVDGVTLRNSQNIWLPPTTSFITHLTKGTHKVEFHGDEHDTPVVGWRYVNDETVFRSPESNVIDFTVFVGDADDAISAYRQLTGGSPMMPLWSLGYIHCRERFNTQSELLENAKTFRDKNIPISMIVQDWQYWGKHGWNAMRFDEERYPNPRAMVDSLHGMDIKLMLSVWSKIDRGSELGKRAAANDYYIHNTDWIDFFNHDAADFYWRNYSERLLKPYGIDAWWQDATEPENDDLLGRKVNGGKDNGNDYRNVYPLFVNRTVYEGLRNDCPDRRPLILTRSAFSGMQRYATATWSGDIGNDWGTLKTQIIGGLGMMASGLPWWTYDAGGFFRPANQYTDKDYQERMLRWIEAAVFLPMMRVHGYMSQTEPWRYGEKTERIFTDNIRLRYKLLPYIYSEAARVTFNGSTLMRPLVMDFADDATALKHDTEFMFGSSILVAPVTMPRVSTWEVYLPKGCDWCDFWTNKVYKGGQTVNVSVTLDHIPVFVKCGSIIPMGDSANGSLSYVKVYPGADASFSLYEDDGNSNDYEKGVYARTPLRWNDAKRKLEFGKTEGKYANHVNRDDVKVEVVEYEEQNMPIIQTMYTADPAPLVYHDTVFLYTTHDEDDATGFKMFDWLLFTSTDMVNWTAHGAVASTKNFAWRNRDNGAWAEQVVERNGKFYMYCPLHGHGIGVLVSDSPYGPFTDPLGKPLVWNTANWYDIDPTVFIDDDGQAYMYWGNPVTYYARLNEDMISLKDSVVQIPHIEDYQEGPWFYKRDNHYYLAFASTCCPEGIGYAMSDKPTGPWQYKGHIMNHTPKTRGNHPGIIDYKGRSYVFGLNYDILRLQTAEHSERRSVSVAEISYNDDGTIKEVPYFKETTLKQTGLFNPYKRVEAETMAWGYGLKLTRNTDKGISVTNVDDGETLTLRGVDFGKKGAKAFFASTATDKTDVTIEIRLDNAHGKLIGTLPVECSGTMNDYRLQSTSIKGARGVHDLVFVFRGKHKTNLLNWDFWEMR